MKTGLKCKGCASPLVRQRRNWWERALYRTLYRCLGCQGRVGDKHRFYIYFGREARCPCCGTAALARRHKPDKLDRVLQGPFRLAHRVAGGALFHCEFCRVQFYDVRRD